MLVAWCNSIIAVAPACRHNSIMPVSPAATPVGGGGLSAGAGGGAAAPFGSLAGGVIGAGGLASGTGTAGGTAGALWISIRTALISSGTSTTFTATNTGDTGGGLTVLRFSGMTRTGINAVRQSKGESTQTENPPTLTFGMPVLTGNPVVLACMGEDNPAALTPPTGFIEADDTGWATPTAGIEVCWDDAGQTTTLLSWSGGALTDHNEVGIELDTSTALGTVIKDLIGAGCIPRAR